MHACGGKREVAVLVEYANPRMRAARRAGASPTSAEADPAQPAVALAEPAHGDSAEADSLEAKSGPHQRGDEGAEHSMAVLKEERALAEPPQAGRSFRGGGGGGRGGRGTAGRNAGRGTNANDDGDSATVKASSADEGAPPGADQTGDGGAADNARGGGDAGGADANSQ